MTRTGPDGALWVVDMYRYMIEHPDWLPAEGKADLLPHYRLGDDRGRLYRILPQDGAARRIPRLAGLASGALVATLESPNGWEADRPHHFFSGKAIPRTSSRCGTWPRPSPAPHAAACTPSGSSTAWESSPRT